MRPACNEGRATPAPGRPALPPTVPATRPGRRALPALIALLLSAPALAPRPAAAHAVVVGSDPPAGAELAAAPPQVAIRFNSRIDHARSRLVLVGPEAVQQPLALAPERDPTLVEAALDPAAPLAPGAWRLRWQVLAVDGHITRGDIPFTLQPR
ncbi:copper resistance CopC family protein [Paracraurococcus ruber]|uniref:copper resistance CopC family protein n=2 Tax=Paracraurococcus ruber TaxID=77675 RepID=UPI001960C95A|nr:copper resistance CopC family protein [Paracraurococcus ruber]